MLRARKKKSEPTEYSNEKGIKAVRSLGPAKHQPLVPTWALFLVVSFFIFLGFATEHYKKSRGIDPVEGRTLAHYSTKAASGNSMLSSDEDKELEFLDGQRYHLIFSTDCSPYQHWQSYLVYFTAMKVRQPGHVTRIVSGCEPDEAKAMKTWFNENIQFMSSRFHIHLTPHFSQVTDETGKVVGDYKFFNKPFGLKHWLENFDLLEYKEGSFSHEDDVVILIDPDMPLMRPITGDFSNERETIIAKKRQGEHQIADKVKRGVPFAQTYGLGVQWQKFDLDKIAGKDSPAKDVNRMNGNLYFPVGPPYLGTVHDMYLIAQKWTEFVPRVHAQYPYLLAEMYAYCIAAAHLKLRHQLVDSLMASNPGTGGEAWPLVDRIPAEEMCKFAKKPDHHEHAMPSVVHLCQRYSVGEEWFFGKHKIPHDIYDCETPLFIEPPDDVATLYDFKKPPNAKERTPLEPKLINQQAFMVCSLTSLLNQAATYYKVNACSSGTANLKKTRTVADLFREKK